MNVSGNFVYDSEGNLIEDKYLQGESNKNALVHFYCRTAAYCALRNSKRLKISYDWRGMPVEFVHDVSDAKDPYKGIDKELAGYIPSAKIEWYLKNHLGSTMLVYGTQWADHENLADVGAPIAAYDYRSFGEQVALTETADKVTENFTGKEKDDETELDYFGARYLDPMLGVWTSVDPMRQFASPYLYVGNGFNPVNGVDPDGNVFVDDAGKALYQKALNNNFWGNKDIENAYRYANETTTEISIEHKGIIRNGPKETLAGVTIPGILDRIVVFFGFADNNYTLGSATVKLSETGINNWADALGISSDEAEARIAAHEFEAHIHNFTPYSDNLGNDPVDIEHDKIKEIDNRLFPEDN